MGTVLNAWLAIILVKIQLVWTFACSAVQRGVLAVQPKGALFVLLTTSLYRRNLETIVRVARQTYVKPVTPKANAWPATTAASCMMENALPVLTPTATTAKIKPGSVRYAMKDTINHQLNQLNACHVLLWGVRYALLPRVAAVVLRGIAWTVQSASNASLRTANTAGMVSARNARKITICNRKIRLLCVFLAVC